MCGGRLGWIPGRAYTSCTAFGAAEGSCGGTAPVSHVAILSLPRPPAPQVPPGAEAPLAPGSRRGASDTAGGSGTGTGTGTRTGAGSGAGAARPRGRWAAVWGGAGLVAMAPCKRSRRRY